MADAVTLSQGQTVSLRKQRKQACDGILTKLVLVVWVGSKTSDHLSLCGRPRRSPRMRHENGCCLPLRATERGERWRRILDYYQLNYIIFAIRYPLFATHTLKGPKFPPHISLIVNLTAPLCVDLTYERWIFLLASSAHPMGCQEKKHGVETS